MAHFKTILCPTDFSEASQTALNQAISLAQDGAGEVLVLYVEPSLEDMVMSGALPDHLAADEHRETVRDLCALVESQTPPEVRTQALVRQGDIVPEILEAAREKAADLIVLATHGREGSEPTILGPITSQILNSSPCPVLVANSFAMKNVAPLTLRTAVST